MPLNLEDKKAIVADVAEIASNAVSAVAAEYRGLTVEQMTELRHNARNAGVYLRVVRNTLAKRAVEGTPHECMKEAMVGPLIFAFSETEPSAAAKLLQEFAKNHDKLQVTALSVGGKLLGKESLSQVAKLPTRDQALSQLLSVMKAPIAKFVQTLAAPQVKLVRTIAAVRDQKQA